MSNDKHHPRCANLIDSVLRCTCAREDAWDDKMKDEEVSPHGWMACGYCDERGCSYCGGEGYVYG